MELALDPDMASRKYEPQARVRFPKLTATHGYLKAVSYPLFFLVARLLSRSRT